ncbi:uncharacterized protein LOC141913217 isoform X2 [Tubulanus polymorphus]|uniref:uncharacterized protein LOC141913217 isoform X2 n=1 Tax=Tubulanus polymorphus TaxID=672921 RepID=UPI003DA35B03
MTSSQGIGGPNSYGAALLDHNPGCLNPTINLSKSKFEPYRPPLKLEGYMPFSKSKTTYNGMNDWMGMQGRIGSVPVAMSDGNWRKVPPLSAPYRPSTQEDYYRKYKELTQKKAYRYPNPGKPIVREGNIGGSWRHVKEVLGNKGYRVIYIDGVVRHYDHSKLNEELADRKTGVRGTPKYALSRQDLNNHRLDGENEFKPWLPPQLVQQQLQQHTRGLPPIYDAQPPRRLVSPQPDSSDRHRGFYQRN